MKLKKMHLEKVNEIASIANMQFPFQISYFLKNMIEIVVKESKPFFERKKAIVEKYRENGKIPPEHAKPFLQELESLHNEEIDIEAEKIDVSIKLMPNMSISQILFIEQFINIR